jgi:hypothetical protein
MERSVDDVMGGVKDYDPFAFIMFTIWAFFLYYIISTNSAINPVAGNATITQQFSITYTNTKWMLYLLTPMVPYLILRFWNQADKEGDSIKSGGFGGFSFSARGRFQSLRKQISKGNVPATRANISAPTLPTGQAVQRIGGGLTVKREPND